LLAFENGDHGQTYNIGASNEIKNIDIAYKICELLDEMNISPTSSFKTHKDLITFVTDRPGHDQRYAIDSSKIQTHLNWRPDESFESGLRKTVQWYLNNKSWWDPILNKDFSLTRIGIGSSK
jgi:dTDP-glucose 4,6-dehydratase